jgi:hypothetical protein
MSFVSQDTSSLYENMDMSNGFKQDIASSFDIMPGKFHGIKTSLFGNTKKNNFFELKNVAINPDIPIEDRMMAVRYMNKIPHKDMIQHTSEAMIKIIEDENIPVNERYFFFSNSEPTTKLDDIMVSIGHYYFFKFSKNKNYPLLRLRSANYIYSYKKHDDTWNEAREFIIQSTHNENFQIKSEAASILSKNIIKEDGNLGKLIIAELGTSYTKNDFELKRSYKDKLKNEILTKLSFNLKHCSQTIQQTVLSEIESEGDKSTAQEFVESYTVRDELEEKYVNSNIISKEEFETIYNKSISDFLGM